MVLLSVIPGSCHGVSGLSRAERPGGPISVALANRTAVQDGDRVPQPMHEGDSQ